MAYPNLQTPGLVYFVQDQASHLIKIGFTTKLQKRLACLARSHGLVLRLLGTRGGTMGTERSIHRMFASLQPNEDAAWSRVLSPHGDEWFRPEPAVLLYILDECALGTLPDVRPTRAKLVEMAALRGRWAPGPMAELGTHHQG